MKRIFATFLISFFFVPVVFGQTTDVDVQTLGNVTLPDITKEGVGSADFHEKSVGTLNFFEKIRLNLKTQIEVKKNSFVREEKKPQTTEPKIEEKINSEKTVQDLESANNDFLYYFLVFALFMVSHVFFFYGLIVVIVLLVFKTFLSSR